MTEHPDIFIVGLNISKNEAYLASRRDKRIARVAHGVYFPVGSDAAALFEQYGLRLAKVFFANTVLTHSTAWYKRPVDGRVFVGGDYPYKKIIAENVGVDLRIVQSLIHPELKRALHDADEAESLMVLEQVLAGTLEATDPVVARALKTFGQTEGAEVTAELVAACKPKRLARMYEYVNFEDQFGPFKIACATPEMLLLQLQDSTKQNVEKHLPEVETDKIVELLVEKHSTWPQALVALEELAAETEKLNEFERLMRNFFNQRRRKRSQ